VGPTCEVLLEAVDGSTLDAVDAVLASVADRIERTRKGRVWDVWIGGRPVHLAVGGPPVAVVLAAGCNDSEDYAVLQRMAGVLAEVLGGIASPPVK